MIILLVTAFIGNLIDTAATLHLTSIGYVEANPIMAMLLQYPILFVTVKMVLMSAVLLWIWNRRGNRKASAAAWIAAVVYGAIALYYAVFFTVWI